LKNAWLGGFELNTLTRTARGFELNIKNQCELNTLKKLHADLKNAWLDEALRRAWSLELGEAACRRFETGGPKADE
jgi:hypothetical protein